MRLSHFVLVVSAALGAAGCSATAAPGDAAALGEPGDPLPVVRLRAEPCSFTDYSGLEQPERTVVRDVDAWREVWAAIWRRHSPQPPLPQVDFAREMLVIAALGQRPTGGFGIFVDSAFVGEAGLVVQVRTVAPGPRCITTQALTQPVDVARVPRAEGAVHFRDRPEVLDCR